MHEERVYEMEKQGSGVQNEKEGEFYTASDAGANDCPGKKMCTRTTKMLLLCATILLIAVVSCSVITTPQYQQVASASHAGISHNTHQHQTSQTQEARAGDDVLAQCMARCYQLLATNSLSQVTNSSQADLTSQSWRCERNEESNNQTCIQCLRKLNAKRSTCESICKPQSEKCTKSCGCLHHVKVENTDTPPYAEHWRHTNSSNVSHGSLQLACRDATKRQGAVLVIRLVDPPQVTESVAVLVQVQPEVEGGLTWTRALISDSYLLELKYLEYNQIYRVRVSIFGPHGRLFAPIVATGFRTLGSSNYLPGMVQNAAISNLFIQGDQLYANVTWKPAEDKICCHKIRRFFVNKPPQSTKICEGSTSMQLRATEYLGKNMSIEVQATTSVTKGESACISLSYNVPRCPVLGQNRTIHSALCDVPPLSNLSVVELMGNSSMINVVDIKVKWHVPPLIVQEARLVKFYVTVDVGDGQEKRIETVNAMPAEEQSFGGEMQTQLQDVEVPNFEYVLSVVAENELGKRGPELSISRRVEGLYNKTAPPWPPTIILLHEIVPSASTSMAPLRPVTAVMTTPNIVVGAGLVLLLAAIIALAARRYSQLRRFKRHTRAAAQGLRDCQDEKFLSKQSSFERSDHMMEYEPLKRKKSQEADGKLNPEPFPNQMHISLENLRFGDVLGEGAFGLVRKAQMRRANGAPWRTVAVKMLKEGASGDDRHELQREMTLMKAVGRHPHIVSMLACSAPHDPPPAPFFVVEHCELGDLQNFLRNQWRCLTNTPLKYAELMTVSSDSSVLSLPLQIFVNQTYDLQQADTEEQTEQSSLENERLEIVSPAELLSIARQVALGMEFLASNRVVHRDLAARNVLVTSDHSVKIADFGLSRDVYEQNVYRKTSEGKLPIKWMALESLLHQVYTSASDVWSYGILLWEIVTLGGTPYPGIATSSVFPLLKSGYRMEKPDNCSDNLYEVMLNCWQVRPSDRPSFSQVRERIEVLLESCPSTGPYLPLQDYCIESTPSSVEGESPSIEITIDQDITEYLQPIIKN